MDDRQEIAEKFKKLKNLSERYQPEAYFFVLEALDFTVNRLPKRRHVSGQELSEGIRDFGLKKFGPLARNVFEHWGLQESLDFGRLVFDLIDVGLLRKQEEDSLEDFANRFDFKTAFDRTYDFSDGDA